MYIHRIQIPGIYQTNFSVEPTVCTSTIKSLSQSKYLRFMARAAARVQDRAVVDKGRAVKGMV